MSEENICKCEHLFYDHGYEKNENPPPHMKSPCKKCECNYFQRPGSQPHVARSIAKTAARQAEEALAVKVEQQENQRREEGRRKYAEIEAKKVEEKEKDLERIRNEYKIKHADKPQEKNYSAHILGPLHAGIYYGKRRNREEHDNHRLSQLLYRNKRYNPSYPELTKEEINEICDPMLSVLPHKLTKIIIPVPNIRQGRLSETKCALSIAAGLAAMINCNSYNDVLVRISKTKHGNSISERYEAAERDYDVAEYIKTAENSIIKDEIVLLIDDITTSGSTAKVCANLLVSYGAKQVIILCAAETKLG
jgi:predicted  nucleic acid-binding Zn-ribbon protein